MKPYFRLLADVYLFEFDFFFIFPVRYSKIYIHVPAVGQVLKYRTVKSNFTLLSRHISLNGCSWNFCQMCTLSEKCS